MITLYNLYMYTW